MEVTQFNQHEESFVAFFERDAEIFWEDAGGGDVGLDMGSQNFLKSRREFFLTGVGTVMGMGMSMSASGAAGGLPEVVVDTHTHFYDPSREGGVPWPQKGSPLYRTVMPEDWKKVARPCGVTHTVIVEASSLVEDNQWILELAEKERSIVGFVGNLDPMDGGFEKNLERFAANPIFLGIRVSGRKLTDFVGESRFIEGMKRLAQLGLSLDVNGGHPVLPKTVELVKAVPDLRVVIDHVGISGDPTALTEAWKVGMRNAAAVSSQVFCKVSALLEQTKSEWGMARKDVDFYRPILDWVWGCFGEDRLIYGSDWPVSDKGGRYEDQFQVVSRYFAEKGQAALQKYFCENSRRAYRWRLRS